MFENITPESIKQNMLRRVASGLQIREGSFTNDLLSAAACELAEVYHSMDALIPALILDETSGQYIDAHAAFFDIYRKPGTQATCEITFTGTDGATIPAGITFSTTTGLTFSLDKDITIVGGKASGTLTAVNVGKEYNVGAGEIVYILKNYSGINSFTNTEASGGTDMESDAVFLARFKDTIAPSNREPPASGNAEHYRYWATSVDGVAHARVFPLWYGNGTLMVVIAGQDGGPVDEGIVARCKEYIETQRPIGANPTVVSASPVEFSIEAEVVVDDTTTKEAVQASLETSVKSYLLGLVDKAYKEHAYQKSEYDSYSYSVIYNRIYFMIFTTPGVVDCTSLTIGGGISNITVPADGVPVLTGVTVT